MLFIFNKKYKKVFLDFSPVRSITLKLENSNCIFTIHRITLN